MMKKNDDFKEDIQKRLRRIEGQIRGIQKMIDDEKTCNDVLTQVSAVRAAINKVGTLIFEKYSVACIEKTVSASDKEKAISELVKTMQSFIKFID